MRKEMNSLGPIMISGYFGFDNCGDEAILLAMIREFSQYIPKTKIIVLSQNPRKTKELYQVNSIHRLNPFSVFSSMRKADVFVSGGGGLLQDVSGKGFSILYYLSLLFFARLFNIPGIIYAQGIGPVEKSINRKLIKWVLNRVNLIMVRDKQSKNILQDLGVRNKPIIVNADPTFLLKKREVAEEIKTKYQLSHHQGTTAKRMNIGMAIRNCKEIVQDYDSKIIQFAEIADHLIEKYQANLIFIPFQVHTDLPLMNEITKKMRFSTAKCIEEELGPVQMLSFISKLSLIIGMRFHSIIFATIVNKPFIAIDYDPKMKNYVYSLGIPELLINPNKLTVKNVENKLKYIEVNQTMIQSILSLKKEQFEQEAFSNVQQLYRFIEENCLRKELTNN